MSNQKESGCGCRNEASQAQRGVLQIVLVVNASMFLIELVTGWMAQSTGLIADSLDMLADAVVYAIALYAVGHSQARKVKAAFVSGIFQMSLAGLVLIDVIQRFIRGSEPLSGWMIGIGGLALVANVYCLWLLARHRRGEVHMRASWVFTRNDVVANLGVIAAGILVTLTQSPFPDLIVGLAIALLVFRGGLEILQDARREATEV